MYDALVTALRNNDKTIKTRRNADNKKEDDNRHKTVCNNHNKNKNNEKKVNNMWRDKT